MSQRMSQKTKSKKDTKKQLKPYRRPMYGKGAYYIAGGVYGKSKIPGIGSAGAQLYGGYSSGNVNIPKMTGLGAYNMSTIRHNVLIKPDIPEIKNTIYTEGGTIIRHREYLGPIVSSNEALKFKIQSFALNPAQSDTFPWLSTISRNYEEYKPNGLMFEFRSTASDAIASSSNLALGQVMMCTQYDPTDPEFTSDIDLLNYTWAQSGKVSDNVQHFVECDPKQSPLGHLYTREGVPSNASDLRFSDFGRFSIATSGLQGTSVQIGQLWVTYEFILYKPKIGSYQAEAGGWYHFYNNVGLSDTNPLGSNPMLNGKFDNINNLSITLADDSSDGLIIFPPQYKPTSYQVLITYVGTSTGDARGPSFGQTTDPGIQFVEHSYNDIEASVAIPNGGAGSRCMGVTWITITGDGKSHTLKVRTSYPPAAVLNVDLYICQIPYLDPTLY